ncbi:unnamed protein product [Sphagnum troendelagicum]|uniref:Uncharacterized protein n=1 Tax=Sphagnum troendelagicum TaxID=128251 RepID=A0ABP0T768_9BRYO
MIVYLLIQVKGVAVNLNELVARIRSDQSARRQEKKVDEPLSITIFNRNLCEGQSTSQLNGQFIHSQLLIDCLRMESNQTDKNQLISVCQQEYDGNDEQLIILREFEQSYSRDRSLWWYTRDSFVHRLLNKALQMQNIDLLFLFRFLIQDLGQQLQEHRCSSPLTVY